MSVSLKIALGIVCFQALANGLVGVFLRSEINDVRSHGQELASPALTYIAAYGSLIAAVLLLAGVVMVIVRLELGCVLVVLVEAVTALNGLFALFSGVIVGLVAIVLAVVIIGELLRDNTRDWFDAKVVGRRLADIGGDDNAAF